MIRLKSISRITFEIFQICVAFNISLNALFQLNFRLTTHLDSQRSGSWTVIEEHIIKLLSLILFQIIYLNASPAAVYKTLTDGSEWSLLNFRDASGGPPLFDISLLDVLHGIKVAHDARFFDFEHFDADQYLFYEVSGPSYFINFTQTLINEHLRSYNAYEIYIFTLEI